MRISPILIVFCKRILADGIPAHGCLGWGVIVQWGSSFSPHVLRAAAGVSPGVVGKGQRDKGPPVS